MWKPIFLVVGTIALAMGQWDPNFTPGRTTMVHLFEWKWGDIAAECERFLGPFGYAGVQVSPPQECAVVTNPPRPWWERYQPVSYRLDSRSGNEQQFQDMVRRCNAVGVRIYVDAVINHMTGAGGRGTGTGGSQYDGPSYSYPGVPFGTNDFNKYPAECPNPSGEIGDYNNPIEVSGTAYVREKIIEFMNKLIGYGVAGFRIDASKHMWPADMGAILGQLQNLNTAHGFAPGSRALIFQEVIDLGGEPIRGDEYFGLGRVTEFKYGNHLGRLFRGRDQLKNLVNWGEGWGMYPDGNTFVFIDNHDNQRGHGAGGADILTYRTSRLYKMATAFKLAHPYGIVRIMSSYHWDPYENDWTGPPNTDGNIIDVPINPDATCGGGWVCEHRWRQIFNMVRFRNVALGQPLNDWWDNNRNQIAFSRGDKGFIAINNDDYPISTTIQTGLPPGDYCDIISGNLEGGRCTGKTITVDSGRRVTLNISNADEDPIVALHVEARL